jgi:ubiquinone/menaquinone biosynthesis C-methylase UbiE
MNKIENPEVARYWDQNADVWADQVRKGYDTYREVINNPSIFALIGNVRHKCILDAGCGEGYNTRKLAKMGAKVTGIDISPKMIRAASDEETKDPLGIEYRVSSFSKMPVFPDLQFDMVVSFMALMDGPDYDAAITEIHRVLKVGGLFIFSIIHPCFLTRDLRWIRDENSQEDRLVIGNYFKTESYVDRWKFSQSPEAGELPEFQVPYFPRTLSGFLNPLLETGFELIRIEEPKPNEDACEKFPQLTKWAQHAAIFLQVKARKK